MNKYQFRELTVLTAIAIIIAGIIVFFLSYIGGKSFPAKAVLISGCIIYPVMLGIGYVSAVIAKIECLKYKE